MNIDRLIELEKSVTKDNTVEQQWRDSKTNLSYPPGMTEVECVVLDMLQGAYYQTIQKHLNDRSNENEFDKALWDILDSALMKCLKYNGNKLYRMETTGCINDYKPGETFIHPYYLTTTSDKQVALSISSKSFLWEITTLGNKSKAVSLLKQRYGECQVEFPRGTKFRVENIDNTQATPILKVIELS